MHAGHPADVRHVNSHAWRTLSTHTSNAVASLPSRIKAMCVYGALWSMPSALHLRLACGCMWCVDGYIVHASMHGMVPKVQKAYTAPFPRSAECVPLEVQR